MKTFKLLLEIYANTEIDPDVYIETPFKMLGFASFRKYTRRMSDLKSINPFINLI